METLKNKILYEYRNKKCLYYNTESTKFDLMIESKKLKKTLNNKQKLIFQNIEKILNNHYKNLTTEAIEFTFDYIERKLEIK